MLCVCYQFVEVGNYHFWLHRLVSCSLRRISSTGEDHGLFDSSITPSSSIFRTRFSTFSCFAKGSRRGPWRIGWASPVFIRCRIMFVVPEDSPDANIPLCFCRNSLPRLRINRLDDQALGEGFLSCLFFLHQCFQKFFRYDKVSSLLAHRWQGPSRS